MKSSLLLFFVLLITLPLHAQEEGRSFKVLYKKIYQKSINSDKPDAFDDPKYDRLKKAMEAMFRRMERLRYNLWVSNNESIFQKQEQLQNDGLKKGGREESLGGGDGIYYFNKEKKELIHKKRFPGGKFYRIVMDYPKYDWTVHKETKIIAGYTCYRATAEIKIENAIVAQSEESTKTTKATKTIEAWFSPNLPSMYGPTEYIGLPGLVLMAGEQVIKFKAVSVELIDDDISIEKPTEGEQITNEEYSEKIIKSMKRIRGF